MSTTVLHETSSGIATRGQTMDLQRTYELTWRGAVNVARREKVRVTVHVDDYVQQSRYTAEVFDGHRWNQVVLIDPADSHFTRMRLSNVVPAVSGYDPEPANKTAFLDKVAEELLARAKAVLA